MNSTKQNILTKKWMVCLTALFCNFLWGSATPSIKTGYRVFQILSSDTMSVVFFAGIRFILAGILTILFGSITGKKFLKPEKNSWKNIALLSAFQTVIQYFFFYIGLAHTTGVKGAILTSLCTFFAILFSTLIFRMEKLSWYKLIGCMIGFAGVVAINLTKSGLGGFHPAGDGCLVLSAMASATSSVLLKKYSSSENPVVLSGYQFLLGGIVMAIAGYLAGGRLSPTSGFAWILMMYLGFISAAAYSLWGLLLKYNTVSGVTIYGFSNPIFGVLLSTIFLSESNSFSPLQCGIALILVCAGILIVNGSFQLKQKSVTE